MRITPTYKLTEDLPTWLDGHGDLIFDEILQSAEDAARSGWTDQPIPVLLLETAEGSTMFSLASIGAAKTSLELAITHFVEAEAYEKAARVRDCQKTLPA